ncbi:MAG: hypothetical protein ACTHL5_07195 [Rhodanobacter sp.]
MQVIQLYPDLPISSAIGNEHIAFVSTEADTVDGMPNTVAYRKLARRFKDVRGGTPRVGFLAANTQTVLLARGAEIAFRNVVMLSAIAKANLLSSIGSFGVSPVHWSDYFKPFVYTFTGSEYEDQVVGQTPSQLGIDDASTFRPITNPELSALSSFGPEDLDGILFQALDTEWRKCFTKGAPEELTEAQARLFRSLEMAFIAAGMPYDSQGTAHDYGTRLSLWVSAMEILVNAKGAERKKLNELLGKITTGRPGVDASVSMPDGKGNPTIGNLLQHLLMRIYGTRNDFLHGNKVTADSLCYWADGVGPHRLGFAATLIYRLVLLRVLDVAPFSSMEPDPVGRDIDWVRWLKWFDVVKRPAQPETIFANSSKPGSECI